MTVKEIAKNVINSLSSNFIRPVPYRGNVFKTNVWNFRSTLKNIPMAVKIIRTPKIF